MTPASQRPRLTPEVFRLLRDLINAHAGLEYHDDAQYAFERRLSERLATLGLPSFNDYYQYLRLNRGGTAELDEALDVLTTKETYFFRQDYQLRALRDELLPKLADRNARSRRLAIWSAGCSTGEEVYSVAIYVLESGLFDGWEVRVIGSDLSKRSVAQARRGVYRPSAFRSTPPELRREYFDERTDGSHITESVKRLCHFGQLNLLDAARASIVGRVDVVLCRNVLIYFDPRARARVIENLYERLLPGGYLLLGHSESLWNVSTAFELCHLTEDLVYRKPVATGRLDPPDE
ncbi:MAG: protein-glutamate O-methyltransferase CheR [Polyangiaceae bacterium]|nr:protein-glutamate O-methyltransferase CheR [Polyangiaceae bacterium]